MVGSKQLHHRCRVCGPLQPESNATSAARGTRGRDECAHHPQSSSPLLWLRRPRRAVWRAPATIVSSRRTPAPRRAAIGTIGSIASRIASAGMSGRKARKSGAPRRRRPQRHARRWRRCRLKRRRSMCPLQLRRRTRRLRRAGRTRRPPGPSTRGPRGEPAPPPATAAVADESPSLPAALAGVAALLAVVGTILVRAGRRAAAARSPHWARSFDELAARAAGPSLWDEVRSPDERREPRYPGTPLVPDIANATVPPEIDPMPAAIIDPAPDVEQSLRQLLQAWERRAA
jgi:hypothetical protein